MQVDVEKTKTVSLWLFGVEAWKVRFMQLNSKVTVSQILMHKFN